MTDERIRILVFDDHPVVREGVAGLVDGQSDMSIVAQASNGREAIQQFRAKQMLWGSPRQPLARDKRL